MQLVFQKLFKTQDPRGKMMRGKRHKGPGRWGVTAWVLGSE